MPSLSVAVPVCRNKKSRQCFRHGDDRSVTQIDTHVCVFIELVGRDVVHGENEFDVVLFGLLDELRNLFRAGLVEKRLSDLRLLVIKRTNVNVR